MLDGLVRRNPKASSEHLYDEARKLLQKKLESIWNKNFKKAWKPHKRKLESILGSSLKAFWEAQKQFRSGSKSLK